ncbi:MAG: SH3 domain-containing protein [Chloroflexi bacterium]|nr:SH3 domain-containing protein [Chloroflexota bacterium]
MTAASDQLAVEPEPEESPGDLTDARATIVEDAHVRARPGLIWPVIDRLESGASVAVRHHAGGFYRVFYGDGSGGWIRSNKAELSDIEVWELREQPAPPLVAEWKGERYGVMGQSADGAELRLLILDEEYPEIVGAPIGESTLLARDIVLDDLPVLIGDETIVFPGNDFRAGQGRILPRANEWMWLPWGWLLAHNEEHIWQWRPEASELQFIRRPQGPAWLSPDGTRVAIFRCMRAPEPCFPHEDLTFVHLDGTTPTSLQALLTKAYGADRTNAGFQTVDTWNHVTWLGGGRIALLSSVTGNDAIGQTAVFFDAADAKLIPFGNAEDVEGRACLVHPPDIDHWQRPLLDVGEVLIGRGSCWDDDQVSVQGYLLFDLNTNRYRLVEAAYGYESESGEEVIRSAEGGEALDRYLDIHWSPSRSRALVFDFWADAMWTYDGDEQRLNPVQDATGEMSPLALEAFTMTRDVYWHSDDAAMVLSRWSFSKTEGAMLLDTASNVGHPLQRDWISNWACLPIAEWSPNGELFQTTFAKYPSDGVGASDSADWHWVDGTARIRNATWQHNISFSDGSLVSALRGIGGGSYSAPHHVGAWSPDGRWFALGGHQQFHRCDRGW